MNPTRRTLLAAAGPMFLLAGCSSSGSKSPTSGGGATATGTGGGGAGTASAAASPTGSASGAAGGNAITIQNFAFSPADLSVAAGATVTVANKDSVTHTVTAGDSPKSFDTGNIAAGATTAFKAPAKAGTYAYSCTIHPFMHGTLTVA